MDKVPKAGSSTWVESFLLLANQTEAAISSMVGELTQVSPNDNLAGPRHETQKYANTLSTAEPRPVERHRQLKSDLYGGSVRPLMITLILCTPVTPWTASLPPTSTRLSRERTATTGGYLGSRSGPNSLRWCWGSLKGGTSTGLLSPLFVLLVWGGNKNLTSLQNVSCTFKLSSDGSEGTQQLLAWKLFQKTPPISFTGWQKENVPPVTPLLSHVCTCDMGHWTFIIVIYHLQVGTSNHTCETHTCSILRFSHLVFSLFGPPWNYSRFF